MRMRTTTVRKRILVDLPVHQVGVSCREAQAQGPEGRALLPLVREQFSPAEDDDARIAGGEFQGRVSAWVTAQ